MKVLELPKIKEHEIVKENSKCPYTQEELDSIKSLREPKNIQRKPKKRHNLRKSVAPKCFGDERSL